MADAAGYYVGRPMNIDEQKAPTQPAPKAVGDQVNVQVPGVPGYYAGRVDKGKTAASDQSSAPPAAQQSGEPSFLAKCFGCFSGGANAR